jgi:hypothetical protein
MEGTISGMFDRQSPGTVAALEAADEANRRLQVVDDAILRSRDADSPFTGDQLGEAIEAARFGYGANQFVGEGWRPFVQLQRAASRCCLRGSRVRPCEAGARHAGRTISPTRWPHHFTRVQCVLFTKRFFWTDRSSPSP